MKHCLVALLTLSVCATACASAPAPEPQLAHAIHPGEPLDQVPSAQRPFDPRFGCPVNLAGPDWHACNERAWMVQANDLHRPVARVFPQPLRPLDLWQAVLVPEALLFFEHDRILALGAQRIGECLFEATAHQARRAVTTKTTD